jgi:hypothetical protein
MKANALLLATALISCGCNAQDERRLPSCQEHQWAHVAEQLRNAARERLAESLVSLVHTYVCGKGASAERVLHRSTPELVLSEASGTGAETTRTFVKAKSLHPHGCKAWDVSVENDPPDVAVSFFVNEACVHVARFRYAGPAWLLVQIGDGCD